MKRKSKPEDFTYISPQALRVICDANTDNGRTYTIQDIQPNSILYAHSLRSFFERVLPQLTHPFILVSSFNDYSTPGRFIQHLDDPRLLHWHGINQELIHPKLSPLPLGIDANCEHWLTATNAEDIPKRHLLYMNYRLSTNHTRRALMAALGQQPWVTTAPRTERPEYYRHIRQSHFVLSPPGWGMDCYRTWETLALGSYPVVKSSPLDRLYVDLPVCIVRDWSDVTPDLLTATLDTWRTTSFNMQKLTAAYWHAAVNATARRYRG